jgi:hypothetical protein
VLILFEQHGLEITDAMMSGIRITTFKASLSQLLHALLESPKLCSLFRHIDCSTLLKMFPMDLLTELSTRPDDGSIPPGDLQKAHGQAMCLLRLCGVGKNPLTSLASQSVEAFDQVVLAIIPKLQHHGWLDSLVSQGDKNRVLSTLQLNITGSSEGVRSSCNSELMASACACHDTAEAVKLLVGHHERHTVPRLWAEVKRLRAENQRQADLLGAVAPRPPPSSPWLLD